MLRARMPAALRAALVALVLAVVAGAARAGDSAAELCTLIEEQDRQIREQNKQIEQLMQRLEALTARQAAGDPAPKSDAAAPAGGKKDDKKDDKAAPDPDAVKKVVAEYLKDNPGAGMPPGVQTGFFSGQGFVIRSAPDPSYVKWEDESRIPFELRIHGRIQANYYGYKVTDDANHETGAHQQAQDANAHRFADFSQLEIKRARVIFEGNAFDPDLRYFIELDGNTRGLQGVQNNKVIENGGVFDPNASAASPTGGGVQVDHAVRLYTAYIAYDFRGCASQRGCGADCPDGTYKYAPTYTLIVGKLKPFFALEEYLGSANEQFVEFSMADWYFDADDDNHLMGAGTQIKAFDDRLYVMAIVTNGNESQFPNTQMDELPGFNAGFWYDLGGNWNGQRQRWDLFGDSLADIDWSCRPVVRVGGAVNLAPMDRRSLYGDDEQSRVFVMPAAPGGTRLINLLNGDGSSAQTTLRGAHAVDKFDSYTYEAFLAAKWHGFSVSTDWWLRDLNGFKAAPTGDDLIFYTYTDPRTKGTVTALFPDKALLDYGMQLQGGYFLVPKKLEVVARWSWVRGDSGDLIGDLGGPVTSFRVPSGTGAALARGGLTRVQVNPGAFSHFHEANEYTVGLNYYFRRQLLKWQTDVGFYTGGNPAGGGVSPAGFIAGEDGWLVRTQVQLAF